MPATTCFIIGPMGDANLGNNARLKILARDIIKPLLDEDEWNLKIQTPFDIDGFGLIMDNVIAAIDHADLIVADLTKSNPNVFYELALCHALGLPTVIVKEDDGKKVPFDVGAFSYNTIKIDDPEYSKSRLRGVFRRVRKQIEDWTLFSNPVTTFYRAPITNISPAAGLAQGMYHNFVDVVVRSLTELDNEGNVHTSKLKIGDEEIENARNVRKGIKLILIIPSELSFTLEDRIQQVKSAVKQAEIHNKGRVRTMFSRWDEDKNCHQLFDIPTTMNTMIESIGRRANQLNVKRNSTEWRQLEEQEIGRFHLALKQWIDDNPSDTFKERVNVIQFNVKERNPGMNWLYNIWGL